MGKILGRKNRIVLTSVDDCKEKRVKRQNKGLDLSSKISKQHLSLFLLIYYRKIDCPGYQVSSTCNNYNEE